MQLFMYGSYNDSTQEQKLHGMSADNQIEALQKYCEEHGYQYRIYNDAGVSGSKSYKKRPALLQMLSDCQANLLDIILFTRLDRFFRSVKDYYECIEQMNGVPWKAIWESYSTTTPDEIFKVNIMLSVAQAEAQKTSQRLKDSYQYRKAKGVFYGRPPVGYKNDHGQLVKDPETMEGVQALFDTYIQTLSSARALEKAQEYGIVLSRGSLPKILKNPAYAGTTFNGHKCEPYITEEQQDLICNVKNSRKTSQKYPNRVYIFSGVLVCGYCGRRMVGKTHEQRKLKNGKIVSYGRYTCQGDLSTRNHCPTHLEISLGKMEQIMFNRLDIEIGKIKHSVIVGNEDVKKNLKRHRKLSEKLRRAKELYIEGEISKDMYLEKKMQIEKDMSTLQIKEAKIPDLPKNWKEVYTSLDPEHKQIFWKKVIDRVIITNENKDAPDIFFRC